mmetsp:Transcript_27851/g.69996  ORF Transcript_27851/g.69996 Transcript_27851/m.69996 type:complete len:602 (-) Transcript_27851:291-2096(-)
MFRPSAFLVACGLAQFAELGHARLGMRRDLGNVEHGLSAAAIEKRLLVELEDMEVHGKRLTEIRAQLLPMYAALPKRDNGGLDHKVVRYALHRFFVHQRGWHLHGLEPSSDVANSSAARSQLSDRMPAYIQGLLEERLHGKYFSLRELVVLAATIEDLVHNEEMQWLSAAYAMHSISTDGEVSLQQVDLLLDSFMFFHVVSNVTLSSLTQEQIKAAITSSSNRYYAGWRDTRMWVSDTRLGLEQMEREHRNPFDETPRDFFSVAHTARELGSRFGRFQDLECRGMKQALIDVEQGGSGRVPLRRFHGQAANSGWGFSESEGYLRHLGVLDESDAQRPSVVIPNYMTSRTNCLPESSGFYSVCCINECEELLGSLERDLASPHATPEQLIELVAALPSETVEAPRNLSAQLVGRLHDIAAHHGSRVPVHGRLFAQWMHHAYPRECPYPHAQGSLASPRTPDEWMATDGVGSSAIITKAEIHAAANSAEEEVGEGDITNASVELPWSAEEELPMLSVPTQERSFVRGITGVCLSAAFISATILAMSTCKAALTFAKATPSVGALPLHSPTQKQWQQQPLAKQRLLPPRLLGRFSSAEQKSHFC